MVDLALLQSVSYIAGALGVCVAAFYYALNIRETTKNRRATLTNSIVQPFTTKEFTKDWMSILAMKWDGFQDFQNKYDSRTNPENFALRISLWNMFDSIGYQCRSGLIDVGTVYNVAGLYISTGWLMFGPVIREYRKSDYSSDRYENFEYIAGVLTGMREKRDPNTRAKTERVRRTHEESLPQ